MVLFFVSGFLCGAIVIYLLCWVLWLTPAKEVIKTLRHRLASDPFDLSAAMVKCDTLKAALVAMTEQKDALLERAAKQKETLDAIRKAFE